MKITKLMLSALVAAAALVSCNKEDHDPVDTKVKSISISLGNAIMTKGVSDGKVTAGAVTVNSLRFFFLDNDGKNYKVYTFNNENQKVEANTYIELSNTVPLSTTFEFHYVDPAVTKVAIIANVEENVQWDDVKNGYNLSIEGQQDPNELILYGIDPELTVGEQKTHTNGDVTVLYTASVTLMPTVSRFEVDGFRIGFGTSPKFSKINITQIAFQNYYPYSNAVTGEESGALVSHFRNLDNESYVFQDFEKFTTPTPWYTDKMNLELSSNVAVKKVGENGLSYHFFADDVVPEMVINMLVDGRPAYVYSEKINVVKNDGTTEQLTSLVPGRVYRMSAKGAVLNDDPDGYIKIPETKIDPANHCIDITVDVVDWVVTLVQPEFK